MASDRNVRPAITSVNRNPLQVGTLNFLGTKTDQKPPAIDAVPKKYTLYPPLLLLPVNFASASPAWTKIYKSLSQSQRQDLFSSITNTFRPQDVTHVAINAPISPEIVINGSSNVMRSPLNLTPVYGDFGPTHLLAPDQNQEQPSQDDFDAAFWVLTSQNGGIMQTWAPLWTMFSRGNITEKARILGQGGSFAGLTESELGQPLPQIDVVDLFVGIGYFAFSYLKRGFRRVFGWEINGWSVEGLRRGCESNGWACIIIKVDDQGIVQERDMQKLAKGMAEEELNSTVRCVVFWGNNRWAADIMDDIKQRYDVPASSRPNVRHVNLGLLPSARPSWFRGLRVLDQRNVGWLHIHENVDINEMETIKTEVFKNFKELVRSRPPGMWKVKCLHIEQVKTYAPGIMHCVFDVQISPGF